MIEHSMNFFNTLNNTTLRASDILLLISGKGNKYLVKNAGKAYFKNNYLSRCIVQSTKKTEFSPAKPDKSLYAGLIYAGRVYKSATVTNEIYFF